MSVSVVYVTVADREAARRLASTLVTEHLIACANVIGPVESIYRWQGRVEVDEEVVLILKAATDRVEEVISRVVELHDYDIPCVTSWPVAAGCGAYLGWVEGECLTDA